MQLANNVRLQSKRAFSSALVCSFGGLGGLISQLLFDTKYAPSFTAGVWVAIGSQIGMIFVVVGLTAWFKAGIRKTAEDAENHTEDTGRESFVHIL